MLLCVSWENRNDNMCCEVGFYQLSSSCLQCRFVYLVSD